MEAIYEYDTKQWGNSDVTDDKERIGSRELK